MSAYTVWAEVRLKPEHSDDAFAAVAAIVDATRAEPGCEQFIPNRAADGAPVVYIFERWRDRAAFDFHHAQPYTKAVYAKYEAWLAAPVNFIELQDL